MNGLYKRYQTIERRVTDWTVSHGTTVLRISVGVIYFWFGVLKFFPGLSPAQDLAIRTIDVLSFGLIPGNVSILLLATWECLIGIGLIFKLFLRTTLFLLFLQLVGTVMPIFFFPNEVFFRIPYAATLEGQYIIKNLVLASAGLVIWGTTADGNKSEPPHHQP
ncbi:MAG TPA: hypothetical protein PKN04_10635 [bacterium]|nr:hypothetical protein [bacterium]HOX85393.1 hypothetical protein [bacterium]HPG44552.1 hypothetical protein [bacterium]HPM97110.1 hypothetical protein [bacterium]